MVARHGATLTILVVDDDQAVAGLLRELLNDVPGWGATVVHDAAAARAVFHHIKVEVLVVDVNLPGINGIELLELLRRDASWEDPPVILISAVPDQAVVHDALVEDGSMTIIPKPFDVDQLIEAVDLAVRQRFGARTD